MRRTLPFDGGCVRGGLEEGGKGGRRSDRGKKGEEDGQEESLGMKLEEERKGGRRERRRVDLCCLV